MSYYYGGRSRHSAVGHLLAPYTAVMVLAPAMTYAQWRRWTQQRPYWLQPQMRGTQPQGGSRLHSTPSLLHLSMLQLLQCSLLLVAVLFDRWIYLSTTWDPFFIGVRSLSGDDAFVQWLFIGSRVGFIFAWPVVWWSALVIVFGGCSMGLLWRIGKAQSSEDSDDKDRNDASIASWASVLWALCTLQLVHSCCCLMLLSLCFWGTAESFQPAVSFYICVLSTLIGIWQCALLRRWMRGLSAPIVTVDDPSPSTVRVPLLAAHSRDQPD